MAEREVMASEFKQRCLALLDEVERTGVALVVTKRGRPVARVVALDRDGRGSPMTRSVSILVDEDDLLLSTGEGWGAEG